MKKRPHILHEVLCGALSKKSIKLCHPGSASSQVLGRLAKRTGNFQAPLSDTQLLRLAPYFKELLNRGADSEFFAGFLDELKAQGADPGLLKQIGNLSKGTTKAGQPDLQSVDAYLADVDRQLRHITADPIRKRIGLDAKARCLEFNERWGDAIAELNEMIRIDESQLRDCVEGARVRIRVANAHLKECRTQSYKVAEEVLLIGLTNLRHKKVTVTGRRTFLEVILTLARVRLRLKNPHACQQLLEEECEPILDMIKKEIGADVYPSLWADYHVRLGVALKDQNDFARAREHLLAGALIRANLGNLLGTAHAIRHFGGLYAKSPEWVNDGNPLYRALWFYLAALQIFYDSREYGNRARIHWNCGNVLVLLLNKNGHASAAEQKRGLQDFANNIESKFSGEEAKLISAIRDKYANPHCANGIVTFVQPYRDAAIAHFERCIELEECTGCKIHSDDAQRRLAEVRCV